MNDIFENTETMKENEHPRFYTAESVMRGHPDKLCDLIADSVLDECLKHDPASRVACEVMATHGHIIVAGEITTSAKPDVFNIVRDTLRDVGYDPKGYQIDCYMRDRVMSCDSYQKALSIVSEYVETELPPSPTPKHDRGDAR